MNTPEAQAVAAWQAEQIRAFINHEVGGDIIDAARILPLVGWDVELAAEYLCEELMLEQTIIENRTRKAQPWKAVR